MSFTYLPGQAAYSPAGSLVLDQSATSKRTPTAPRLSRPVSVMDFLTMRLSGQMSGALPGETTRPGASSGNSESLDAALWLRRVFLASPSRPQEKCGPNWTKETAGRTPFASLEKSDPAGCYWRTCQGCFLDLMGTMDRYSESWPRAGILQGGTVYRLRPLAPLTKETGSGLWPTPTVPNGGRVVGESAIWTGERTAYSSATGQKMQVGLETMVRRWPTPTTDAAEERNTRYAQGGTSLSLAVKLWPTPRSSPSENRTTKPKPSAIEGRHGWGLADAVQDSLSEQPHVLWPTPTGAVGSGGPGHSGREGGPNLRTAVSLWPTPTINGNYNRKGLSATSGDGLATAVNADQLPNQVGGSLNPEWVELLMGWPKGWTSLEPLPLSEFEEWLSGFVEGKSTRYGMQAWIDGTWEEDTPRTVTGMKNRQARLRAIGNGQVPIVVAIAWEVLSK